MTQPADRSPLAASTLALLWERVRRQGDMPGFTRAVGAVLAALRGEAERDFSMTQTVLSDPVLTQRVLRLANSGMYAAFGQRIDTVSKAVLVLGTETIGHLALGLKLVEELSRSRPDSAQAHAEMEKAVLAGMVAQQVAGNHALRDPEAAVVCAILHSLGRMMVTFYLPERWSALQERGAGHEDAAAQDLLGLSLEAIGRAAAEHWGLPRNLVAGMRSLPPAARQISAGHEDWLAAIGTMSSRCAQSLWNDDEAGADEVRRLAGAYGPMLGIEPRRILEAVAQARVEAAADLTVAPLARPQEKRERQADSARRRASGNRVMMAGAAELRETLAQGGGTRMVELALEAMHRGLDFSRSFAFLRNRREALYLARMGLGEDINALAPGLRFGDGYEPTVFHAALKSDRVIFIEDAHAPGFANKLPQWWKATLLDARAFVILPLCVRGDPAGFLYGDWRGTAQAVAPGPVEFGLLNDLRTLLARSLDPREQRDVAASRA
ncbi:HDOD domain-containing protein [Massilia agilis]|uniref:HDOD domain-containing protein n=1 Tax=Massilia agilis TaxID=1811226 RepID=A0ABT2D8Z0_9BURK|nr:HDOD domain-containing protein [Massilia agilis]MCS0807781.1 HDOD domain-containing protein [Massilia agilis]